MRKNDAVVAKIANMRLTKTFVAIFTLAERLPTSVTLLLGPEAPSFFLTYWRVGQIMTFNDKRMEGRGCTLNRQVPHLLGDQTIF